MVLTCKVCGNSWYGGMAAIANPMYAYPFKSEQGSGLETICFDCKEWAKSFGLFRRVDPQGRVYHNSNEVVRGCSDGQR